MAVPCWLKPFWLKFRLKWVRWGPLRIKADSFAFLSEAPRNEKGGQWGRPLLLGCMSSPRDGEPEPADPPSPEFRSGKLAPLPAVAETPADQLGRHRDEDEDDSDNPWAGLFRPVALQFDGDEADEVPHTPAQEESQQHWQPTRSTAYSSARPRGRIWQMSALFVRRP